MRKDKNEKGEVSRRDFLIGASAVLVGGAIGAGITYPLVVGKGATLEISKLEILNPVGDLATPIVSPAPRLDTLEGKRVALYIARRANSFELVARIAENLKNQFPTIELLGGVEGSIWSKPSYDRTAEEQGIWDKLMAEKPDGIIMALSS